MGFGTRVLLVGLSLLAAVGYQNYKNISRPLPIPEMDVNAYWGPGSKSSYKEDPTIKPFTIKYEQEIVDLKQQLARPLKLQEPLEGVGFEYGFNSKALEKIVAYWRDSYLTRWTERQEFLNKFPQFTTQIQGLDIHFLHVKPTKSGNKKVVPLLLLHGWPGSVREFYELIPLLTKPSKDHDYVFEVIAPSLVGFGWSQGSAKQGLGPAQMAAIFRNLMLRVGHERFLIHGGDWGSVIGSDLATFFPQNTIGYHSNMCLNSGLISFIKLLVSSLYPPAFFEKRQEKFHLPVGQKFVEFIEESGYLHLQATKPDTIGTVLLNNPSGLAAYILEKVSTFTNLEYRQLPDGGLEKRYTLDALLDNIMVYYLTNSINTAQRLYSEAFSRAQRSMQLERVPVTVPTGCARFEYDMWGVSDWQLKGKYVNLVHSSYHDDGGHFAALEVPKVLYKDFIEFIKKVIVTQ